MISMTRAMVVDVNPQATAIVTEALKACNCDYRIVTTGDEALRVAASFVPDIVVMSVTIPDQDGWLVCRKLKCGRQQPKVMLTTDKVTQRDEHFAVFVRADKLLKNPLSKSELGDLLNEIEQLATG